MRGLVISAAMTGAGKTTVTLGLLAALRQRGVAAQPFKVGPDFIDPGLHEIASGAPSHNLDGWMLSRETNERLFAQASAGKDISIVEGVMGLYDGFNGSSEGGSTAEMAKWLDLPVIIVMDAARLARSAAAVVHGLRTFDPAIRIGGIIFNRVAGPGHFRILADAVTDIPILGWLPAAPHIEIPERRLGLFTAKEELVESRIQAIGRFFEDHIDLESVLAPASAAASADIPLQPKVVAGKRRVAIASDRAFSFYYHANRMALEDAGAQIVEFSPLTDSALPDADLIYIGGGYPELYRKELEANASMRASVRRFITSGGKFYAECGGLMYLAESIDGSNMVGVVPARIQMTDRLVDFGYCEITTSRNCLLGPAGTTARGHQFHYSRHLTQSGDAYHVRQGDRDYLEGFRFPNGVASYIHLHFLSNPVLAKNMLHS